MPIWIGGSRRGRAPPRGSRPACREPGPTRRVASRGRRATTPTPEALRRPQRSLRLRPCASPPGAASASSAAARRRSTRYHRRRHHLRAPRHRRRQRLPRASRHPQHPRPPAPRRPPTLPRRRLRVPRLRPPALPRLRPPASARRRLRVLLLCPGAPRRCRPVLWHLRRPLVPRAHRSQPRHPACRVDHLGHRLHLRPEPHARRARHRSHPGATDPLLHGRAPPARRREGPRALAGRVEPAPRNWSFDAGFRYPAHRSGGRGGHGHRHLHELLCR